MSKRVCGNCGRKVMFPSREDLEEYIDHLRATLCACDKPDLAKYMADYDRNVKIVAEHLKAAVSEVVLK